ncbi:AAA family ATPase [Clavibacter michiganensis subsp. tessellarius]|uniref:AAA family ATPase n=1 Tax=Clavibacter tessellarius TaxID=31965 RepID=UPI001F3F18F0|nr:AAA family ATPase [Clavibacter michiganensis]
MDIEERVTIDASVQPAVSLQFGSNLRVEYVQGVWSQRRPEVKVYDSTFVTRNIHSGTEITAEHRKNLLDFALGDSAVAAREVEADAAKKQQEATAAIRELSTELQARSTPMPLAVFRALPEVQDFDVKAKMLQKRLDEASRLEVIRSQPLPAALTEPKVDIDGVFETLFTTLDEVHAEAETAVAAHVERLDDTSAIDWIARGQAYPADEFCPFCGQSTEHVSLIAMYKSHFNQAFKALRAEIDRKTTSFVDITAPTTLENIQRHRILVNERIDLWSPLVQLSRVGADLDELASTSLENLRELILSLLSRKALAPSDRVGTQGDKEEANRLWSQVLKVVSDMNEMTIAHVASITTYLETLGKEDVTRVREELSQMERAKLRHSQDIKTLFTSLAQAEVNLTEAERERKDARATLSQLMATTLASYRVAINGHLGRLGAAFAIDEFKTNYLGGKARTDYGITLRGEAIKAAGGLPSFATALSEGDKRTMAFAFFVSSMLADPGIADNIVVVDDPMSSLDRSRRQYTINILVKIAAACNQLIVLAHDAEFLRDLQRALESDIRNRAMKSVQIQRVADDYSEFAPVDLERECESEYYTNYRSVNDFVAGRSTDPRSAATALRPVVEGFLHRRYPGALVHGGTLGGVIHQIDIAQTPSVLVHAKSDVVELRELNDFASQFHHDTNPDASTAPANAQEIATYGQRVLDLVHGA